MPFDCRWCAARRRLRGDVNVMGEIPILEVDDD
jgi:hypothetical protein